MGTTATGKLLPRGRIAEWGGDLARVDSSIAPGTAADCDTECFHTSRRVEFGARVVSITVLQQEALEDHALHNLRLTVMRVTLLSEICGRRMFATTYDIHHIPE